MIDQEKTAQELMAELANDASHQQKLKEKEQQRVLLEQELCEDERQLVAEFQSKGVLISSVWDLVNSKENYQAAIPTLVAHLEKPHHARISEGIVRALTTPTAAGIATEPLIGLFRSTVDAGSELKWLVGAAIAETATPASAKTIVGLINDEKHGRGRAFLPLGLIHLPKDEARSILERLTSHPAMGESASKAIALL